MFAYLSKKISIPNNVPLYCVAWNRIDGHIAAGGSDGLLKVLRLEPQTQTQPQSQASGGPPAAGKGSKGVPQSTGGQQSKPSQAAARGLAAPTNLQVNQNLEGHGAAVKVIRWNEPCQKLTTSDANGLIIVWMLYKGTWCEEMINNRNKSVVNDMAWSADAQRIAIAYDDGLVIVGGVDGNRLWSKQIPGRLLAVHWSPDGHKLLFAMGDGSLSLYEGQAGAGPLDSVPVFVSGEAVGQPDGAAEVHALRWYSNVEGVRGAPCALNTSPLSDSVHQRATLCVVFKQGSLQLMRDENDIDPIIVNFDRFTITCAQWSPCGSLLAIGGYDNVSKTSQDPVVVQRPVDDHSQATSVNDTEGNMVHFLNAHGEKLRTLRVPGKKLNDCSWESDGLRLCLAVDSHIFFANIRPNYKWAYCGSTVIYSYPRYPGNWHTSKHENDENNGSQQTAGSQSAAQQDWDTSVVFWHVLLEELYVKHVKQLYHVVAWAEYCCLIHRMDDNNGKYMLQVCNGIGTPVDFKYTNVEPKFAAMSNEHVVVANEDSFVAWAYTVPKPGNEDIGAGLSAAARAHKFKTGTQQNAGTVPANSNAASDAEVVHIGAGGTGTLNPMIFDGSGGISQANGTQKTSDPISCISISAYTLAIGRHSGIIYIYACELPNSGSVPRFSRQFTLPTRPEFIALNCSATRMSVIATSGTMNIYELTGINEIVPLGNIERRDVWCMKWDLDNEKMLAIMEKTRMFVINDTELEEPIISSGYICEFKDLTVRTVVMDELLKKPQTPDKAFVVDIEIKALRDVQLLLSRMSVQSATQFIERHAHPKLWALLVPVPDPNDQIKRAEVAAYFGRFDEAEKIFMENDRRDLAIAMRKRVHDWFRILQLLQASSSPGDDALLLEACNQVGDYYMDRHKWANAARHYEQAGNEQHMFQCYAAMEDYDKLEALARNLPQTHELLPDIGRVFSNAGLCSEAVFAYRKCGMVRQALDVCIELNQWDRAIELARSEHVQDVDELLEKHAAALRGDSDRSLALVQLYRKAGRFLDAARVLYQLAEEQTAAKAPPLRLKKIYVLAALLVEQYHARNKAKAKKTEGGKHDAKAALHGLLEEDTQLSAGDSKLIDNAWRGAEAWHFYMLAQSQLYEGNAEGAMKTALHLTEFDDIIEMTEVYSLLALTACATRQFGVCSRAFIKLESLPNISDQERQAFQNLALEIFTKHNPRDSRANKTVCTGCETMIPDYCQVCPSCDTRFPTCIVTGRPLVDYQFWLCPSCRHRAYEQHIQSMSFCPLCHAPTNTTGNGQETEGHDMLEPIDD